VRGELEIKEFRRYTLVKNLAKSRIVRSMPLLSFTNGFSLYRNIYKSIIGIYLFIAPLKSRYHNYQHNIIPLILGPYGSNPNSV
ncbi:hypothetical protein ACRALDRAFT_2113829, partial [Sodiomyces alcalophilus JCM 7366]|uniref:uncharacterized protein n=1 Tax=Sodiomyces alcalophilus JCM 7366 TaxID=591952 RepID=UPI0039B37347